MNDQNALQKMIYEWQQHVLPFRISNERNTFWGRGFLMTEAWTRKLDFKWSKYAQMWLNCDSIFSFSARIDYLKDKIDTWVTEDRITEKVTPKTVETDIWITESWMTAICSLSELRTQTWWTKTCNQETWFWMAQCAVR